jgi:hypothetical protein
MGLWFVAVCGQWPTSRSRQHKQRWWQQQQQQGKSAAVITSVNRLAHHKHTQALLDFEYPGKLLQVAVQ